MGNSRPLCNKNGAQNPLLPSSGLIQERNESKWLLKCCVATLIVVFILLLLTFIAVFVGIPLAFKYSIDLQRSYVYQTSTFDTTISTLQNPQEYIKGSHNFYVNVDETENITLGVWHILPDTLISNETDIGFNFSASLIDSEYPILLYFHGNAGDRLNPFEIYSILRKFFHVFTFDYRGYADSSHVTPTETDIVNDSVQLYKWLRSQSNSDIYFWGHSLGSALSTHTIAKLSEENIVPMGLFLEAPFSTLREAVEEISLSKLFSWLPWYNSTILDPLDQNGFLFKTTENILMVDCPIMIVHAKDDDIIPYCLGEKVYHVAQTKRDLSKQGNATFHLIPESYHCGHMEIFKIPDLPNFISDHISICQTYNLGRG